MRLVIYQKPTCTTCRQVSTILRESGVEFDAVDYYTDPLSATQLRDLLAKMQMTPRQLLRTKEPIYKELGLAQREMSDDELIETMARHPDLIQRPIAERGPRAVLARPAERIRDIL